MSKTFVCLFHFVGWGNVSFGVSLCLSKPNIEVHLPFGFIKIGWDTLWRKEDIANWRQVERLSFGRSNVR